MLPSSAADQYRIQQGIAAVTAAAAARAFDPFTRFFDFDAGWAAVAPDVQQIVATGRRRAVGAALPYVDAVLAETGQTGSPVADVVADRFLATAPNGAPLDTMFDAAPIRARQVLAGGGTTQQAVTAAASWLTQSVLTVVADTGRAVHQVDIASRPTVTGYVRMLNPPSCSRCAILAGKWFRWNDGFLRHPRCDCRHIPASEDVAGDLLTDPYAYFESLDADAQARIFGQSNARAIREGGDIYRVVNVQQRGLATARGHRLYGAPNRMTPDDIFRIAGTRTNAVRLLEEHGYITGPQVSGGNIVGRYRERFQAPISRPIVPGSARDRVLRARATGVRDPLDRATMTAAERRLYDAWYRVEYARRTGYLPRSIGSSSADRWMPRRPITPALEVELRDALAAQRRLAREVGGTTSDLLGILDGDDIRSIPLPGLPAASSRALPPPAATATGGGGGRPPSIRDLASADMPDDFPDWLDGVDDGMAHIFDGHRSGARVPSKTEFPASWSPDDIRRAIVATLHAGDVRPLSSSMELHQLVIDGVLVEVRVLRRRGRRILSTGYPGGGDGVILNESGGGQRDWPLPGDGDER